MLSPKWRQASWTWRVRLACQRVGESKRRWYAVGMHQSTDPRRHTPDGHHLHVVLRFLRKVTLPRFTMQPQECFGFVVVGKHAQMVRRILRGLPFNFGDGQVLAEHVELAFVGPSGAEFSKALRVDTAASTSVAEPFALDFLVSAPPANARSSEHCLAHLCTVTGTLPSSGHLGAGHWAQIQSAIETSVSEGENKTPHLVHFAGGLPLPLLAQDNQPLKIEGLRVHRKGLVEPVYPLLLLHE